VTKVESEEKRLTGLSSLTPFIPDIYLATLLTKVGQLFKWRMLPACDTRQLLKWASWKHTPRDRRDNGRNLPTRSSSLLL